MNEEQETLASVTKRVGLKVVKCGFGCGRKCHITLDAKDINKKPAKQGVCTPCHEKYGTGGYTREDDYKNMVKRLLAMTTDTQLRDAVDVEPIKAAVRDARGD